VRAQATPLQPQPHRLDVGDDVLDDPRGRLTRTRRPDQIPQSGWQYGSNLAFMRRLTARRPDRFDWRAQQSKPNAFDQFRLPLDAINLHLIHQPGVGPEPLPLLLVHGWPGSLWEFHQLIPRLTDPALCAKRSPLGITPRRLLWTTSDRLVPFVADACFPTREQQRSRAGAVLLSLVPCEREQR
jgi:hypothetical protein